VVLQAAKDLGEPLKPGKVQVFQNLPPTEFGHVQHLQPPGNNQGAPWNILLVEVARRGQVKKGTVSAAVVPFKPGTVDNAAVDFQQFMVGVAQTFAAALFNLDGLYPPLAVTPKTLAGLVAHLCEEPGSDTGFGGHRFRGGGRRGFDGLRRRRVERVGVIHLLARGCRRLIEIVLGRLAWACLPCRGGLLASV
jgi:hypothetical protein